MNLNFKMTDNVFMRLVEPNNWNHEDGAEVVTMWEIAIEFYGEIMSIYVSPSELKKEEPSCAMIEGGNLLSSFDDYLEDDENVWNQIKEKIAEYPAWLESI